MTEWFNLSWASGATAQLRDVTELISIRQLQIGILS
jgi:hypothetical protein